MPFKSKSQQRYMFSQHPRIAERWADHTPDMKDLPEKLSNPKTAGFWSVLLKLGAVDPAIAKNVARVAKRMGVAPPSAKELDRMFPKGWETKNPSWQAHLEKSEWLRNANSAKIPGGAHPGGWTHGKGWSSRPAGVAERAAKFVMRHPFAYGIGGLVASGAVRKGLKGTERRSKRGLTDEEFKDVKGRTTGRGALLGSLGAGLLGAAIPLLAHRSGIRASGGLRNVFRADPAVGGALGVMGLQHAAYSMPWGGALGGYVGSRFMPGAAQKVREQKKAASEEEPVIPPRYLTKKFTIPSGIFGGVSGGIEPPLRIALERLHESRSAGHAPSLRALFKNMPADMKKQILKGSLRGAIGGVATGYLTGRVSDALIQKKLKEKSV